MKKKLKSKFKGFVRRLAVASPNSEDALIDRIWDLFVHRIDYYAVQQEDGGYLPSKHPLTKEIIRKHLHGEITIGLYQISPADNTVKWGTYDLDSGEAPTAEDLEFLKGQVIEICKKLLTKFPSAVLVEFSGKKGYHIWIFFDPPIPAIIANRLLRNIMVEAKIQVHETFPKQGKLSGKGFGNLVKLPFGIHRVSKRRSEIYDGTNWNVLDPSYLFKIEPILTDPQETAALREKIRQEETGWMENTYSQGQPYQGEDPPCVKAYLRGGLGPGERDPVGIQLASYLLNFKGMKETPEKQEQAWQILVDWNALNCPPHNQEKLRQAMFEQALKGKYNYGCDSTNGVWKARCNLKECILRRHLLPELLNELQLSEEEKAEIEKILTNPNCEDDISKHLGNIIAGEKDNALGILNLCLSGKLSDPALKQIILLKATEGAGKSTLMRLAGLFKVKDVGRFSAHALDYSDLSGYEILRLKEIGAMDQETQGVSTIKFLSADDEGYTVEITMLDEKTRKFKTEQYKIPPITLITSTTRVTLDPQFERRAWTFNPDEREEQTEIVKEWKAKYRHQLNEVELELRKETDKDKSWRILRGLVQTLEPCKVIVPFPKALFDMLGTAKLRFRGDYDKLMSLVILNAMLHQRTQPKKWVKGKLIVFSTPEQAVRALKLVEKPLVSMMTELEERTRNMFEILKALEIRNAGDAVTKDVRDKIARKLGRSERTILSYFVEWESSGYVSSDGKKPRTFTLLASIQEMESENLRLSAVLKSADELVRKMKKEQEECPNGNRKSETVGVGLPSKGTPQAPISDPELKPEEKPLIERASEHLQIGKLQNPHEDLGEPTPFKAPLEVKAEEKAKIWMTCSNCNKPIMVGEPRTFYKGQPIHIHCPEGDVRIQKNLVDFTTFLHRKEHTCAICLKVGTSSRVKVEIYLDEIAALVKGVVDKLPFIDFYEYFYNQLNESILHELLHMYGADSEDFCRHATRWALDKESEQLVGLVKFTNNRKWTDEEIKILKENYQQMHYRVAILLPDRTKKAVIRQIENLGLTLSEKSRPSIQIEKALTRLDFKVDSKGEKCALIPFGDIHIGAPNETCNLRYAEKMIKNILAGQQNYVIGMGDYIDNIKAVWQGGRGPTPFESSMSPQEQYETALELLKPLAEAKRLIGLHDGNHDAWTRQVAGIDVTRNLAQKLEVPLLGPGCTTRLKIGKQVYVIYSFHGVGSAKMPGGKLNALMNAVRAIEADVYVMGHLHSMVGVASTHRDRDGITKKCYYVVTGGYLEWDGSYAQNYGLSPEKTGSPWLWFNADRWDIHLVQ